MKKILSLAVCAAMLAAAAGQSLLLPAFAAESIAPAAEAEPDEDLQAVCDKLKQFINEQTESGNAAFRYVRAYIPQSEQIVRISIDWTVKEAVLADIEAFIQENGFDDINIKIYVQDDALVEHPSDPNIPGDATCDNILDVSDAVLIARYAAEDSEVRLTAQGRINADFNKDGEITSEDVTKILRRLAKYPEPKKQK